MYYRPALRDVLAVAKHESFTTNIAVHEPITYCGKLQIYDSLTSPITTDAFQTRVTALLSNHVYDTSVPEDVERLAPVVPALGPSDSHLGPGPVISQLLGVVSPWIDLCSPDPIIHHVSRQVLEMEVAYASFCGITALILPVPKLHHGSRHGTGVAQYAHAVKEAMAAAAFMQFSILTPMMDNPSESYEPENSLAHLARSSYLESSTELRRPSMDMSRRHDFFGTWDAWNVLRSVCKYSNRLFVALIIPRYLPHSGICARWQSEPLRALYMDSTSFFANPSGFPVLTSNHRALVSQYMRLKNAPCIVLAEDTNHLCYLRWFQANQPPKSKLECDGAGYEDYLQAPLQPLAQNLESLTYEVFEQDPVKYDLYERAIFAALKNWHEQNKSVSGQDGKIVVTVLGAGRGPLVTRALKASRDAAVPIELWALEKNPSAFVLLRRQNAAMWNGEVRLVQADMRAWQGPIIDIVISELLGSFADNELSPECLDGVTHLMNAKDGISIPASYTAWLTPIAAPKLHADLLPRDAAAQQTPYVVMLQSHDYLCTKSHTSAYGPEVVTLPASDDQPRPAPEFQSDDQAGPHITKSPIPTVRCAWNFHHGPRASQQPRNAHNARHCRLIFDLRHRGVCHGLAGYFEAVLYPGVELSTNPVTMAQKSANMMSWFPIFFPLKSPLQAPDHSCLAVEMWRSTDGRKVWYEWMVEVWTNNPAVSGGAGYRLACSELMSSREQGCLM